MSSTPELLRFIDGSTTPYHAVKNASQLLQHSGFSQLFESSDFSSLTPGSYFLQRGDSALIAFSLPQQSKIRGFRIIGTHTDSPNLRLKPNAVFQKEGYLLCAVEVYGGVLLNAWFNRDLAIAGRVILSSTQGITSRLVQLEHMVVTIPQLAIHLDREVNERGLVLNRQEHLNGILGIASLQSQNIHGVNSLLIDACAKQLDIDPADIHGIDLMLHDTAPSTRGGLKQEFILAPRLDNLSMCYTAIESLIAIASADTDGIVPIICLFDHEEVGSQSAYGAGSTLLPSILERLALSKGGTKESYFQAVSQSRCISADTAHAAHPNYADRHDTHHRPRINGGPVVKINQQQRYATSASTLAYFEQLCHRRNTPIQRYSHRNDLPCGSTIGPITSTLLGIPTVDVGNAIFSMHSIREMGGAHDIDMMIPIFSDFLCGT